MVQIGSSFAIRPVAARVLPFVIVALAAMTVRTPLAAAHPFAALLLFIWIVSDTMVVALIARSSGRPGWHAVLGAMAGASVTIWLGSPPVIREAL